MAWPPGALRAGRKPASRVLAGFTALVGAIFWLYANQPLHHTDLWGHLAYGRLIWQDGALPATEPFMPLARQTPLVDTAWLTQVAGYLVISRGGPPAIQFLHAVAVAACFGILAARFYRRTRHVAISFTGLAVFEALNWFQFQIVRPQMAGLVFFVALLSLISSPNWRWFHWAAIVVLFVFWANMHGSFVVGLGLVAAAALGRGIDVWRRTHRPVAPFRDRRVRRLLLATALAAVATLLNPYGAGLYGEVLSISMNSNLHDLTEWQALDLSSRQGQIAFAAALALAILYCFSPRRVPADEAIVLIALTASALWSARMLIWWTPLATISLVAEAHALWRAFRPPGNAPTASADAGNALIAATGIACLCSLWTPLGVELMTGRMPQLAQSVSAQTPVAAVAWLRDRAPPDQVFNTFEWGDFLVWAGPPNVHVFMTSQAHLVPRQVWRDYMSVIEVTPGWSAILDRYAVQTVLVDKKERRALIARLNGDSRWVRAYEDDVAAIFTR